MLTKRLMASGEWSVKLDDTKLPQQYRDAITEFDTIVVTEVEIDRPSMMTDAEMLGFSIYTGIITNKSREVDSIFEVSGPHATAYLGDGEFGDIPETPITFGGTETLTQVVATLRPAAVETGTIGSATGSWAGTHEFETPAVSLNRAIRYGFGCEYRVNDDVTLDVGTQDELFAYTTPTAVIARHQSGHDLVYDAVHVDSFEWEYDARDIPTRVVLLGKNEPDGDIPVGGADASHTYKDVHGNTLVRKMVVNDSGVDPLYVDDAAAGVLDDISKVNRLSIDLTPDFLAEGKYNVGDRVWIFDMEAGLYNSSNQLRFRGETIFPKITRVRGMSLPVVHPMGVYHRDSSGNYVNLTPYVVYEKGESPNIEVGQWPTRLTTKNELWGETIDIKRAISTLTLGSTATGGVTDHGALTGLTDDDHTQYLKEKVSGGTAAEVPTHDHSAAGEAGTIDHGVLGGLGDVADHTSYLDLAGTRPMTGTLFMGDNKIDSVGAGTGALTGYDIEIGDTDGTPTYGIARLGNSIFGRTSYNVASLDLDGAVIIRNVGAPATSNIEFVFAESSNSVRFAIPKSGVGNATYNPRSMIIAGPAPLDDTMVTVGYWQGLGIFDNLVMDTGTDGADLGVQNDAEIEGDLFVDSIKGSTDNTSVTITPHGTGTIIAGKSFGPTGDNTLDLGSTAKMWRRVYSESYYNKSGAEVASASELATLTSGGNADLLHGHTASAHASSHSDGGSDEIDVIDLGSGTSDAGDIVTSDGAGGLEWSAPSDNLLGEVIASGTTASITIDLPATATDFDDLMIIGRFRSDRSDTEDQVRVQVGDTSVDTGFNYDFGYRHFRKDTGTTAVNQGDAASSWNLGFCSAGANSAAGVYGIAEATIVIFGSTAAQRQITFNGGLFNTGTTASGGYFLTFGGTGAWKNNTQKIDKIKFFPNFGSNWVSGTQIRVYGLPASGAGGGGGTGTDSDAIHDNVSGEINAITAKATPTTSDLLVIEDAAASYAKKKITLGDIPGGTGVTVDAPILVASADADSNVKDIARYTCNGTADEVEINNAITLAQNDASGGMKGHVRLVGKFFDLDNPIKMKHGVWLQGSGLGTMIRDTGVGAGNGMIELNSATTTFLTKLSDFTLWGNYASGNGHGIKYDNTGTYTATYLPGNSPDSSHLVENLLIAQFTGAVRHGVWVRNNLSGSARDNKFTNVRVKVVGGHGVYIEDSSDNKFLNCIVQGPSQQAAGYAGWRVDGSSNQFTNCKAAFSNDMGWHITSSRNSFVGCHAQDCDYEGWVCNGGDSVFTNIVADSNLAADSGGTHYAIDINASDQFFDGVMIYRRGTPTYHQNRGVHFGSGYQLYFTGYCRLESGSSYYGGTPGTNSKVFLMRDGTTPYEFPYVAHTP